MERRILGKDLAVSPIGLGCMGMSHAYGPPADKKELTELLAQSVDLGYTFFDTAWSIWQGRKISRRFELLQYYAPI